MTTFGQKLLYAGRLLNHLTRLDKHRLRKLDAERLRSLEVDDQLKLGRLHDRQVRRLRALENPGGIDASLPIRIGKIDSVAHEAAGHGIFSKVIHRWHSMARCQRHQLLAARVEEWTSGHRE